MSSDSVEIESYICTSVLCDDDPIISADDIKRINWCRSLNHELLPNPKAKTNTPTGNAPYATTTAVESKLPLDKYQEKLSKELQHMKDVLEANFPERSFAVEVALSVKTQLKIENITQVFTLIYMGRPSSLKSTILEIISALPDCYHSDSFTPKSFVSHSANAKKKELQKVDLLPKIRHKTLITPELAPLFSGNPDQLIEYFGMLTRILDGRGFQSDSGVHGRRGYVGDYSFTWLGAVVDIPRRVWRLLGNFGPKIYFFRLPDDPKTGQEKIEQIKKTLKEDSYSRRIESAKKAVMRFWKLIEQRPGQKNEKIVWDKENDDTSTLERIIKLAMVLANLRASVPTWHTKDSDSGGTNYNFETPIKEDPSRASSALYNLARGHALLYGRNYITKDDLAVVIPVALSSAPRETVDLFRLLIENSGTLTTDQFIAEAKVSRATARKEMEKMHLLELVDPYEEEGVTKPILGVKLKDRFDWFLSEEFKEHWKKFTTSLTPKISKLSQTQKENLEKNRLSERGNIDSFFDKNDAG